jgi:hypothetical protein
MVQVIKPHEVRVITQQGEVTVSIVLELNINLNADGGLNVATRAVAKEAPKELASEGVEWAIPEFDSAKIKFGKHDKE